MIRDLLLIAFILAGAVGASQVPRFVQEYEQRLGGARDEAQSHLKGFREIARSRAMSFEAYLIELRHASGGAGQETSDTIRQMADRSAWLDDHAARLARAGYLERSWVVFSHPDPEILRATWAIYRPGVFLDTQYGLIGVALGWALFTLLGGVGRALFGRRGRGRKGGLARR